MSRHTPYRQQVPLRYQIRKKIISTCTYVAIALVAMVGIKLSSNDHNATKIETYPWSIDKLSALPTGIADPLTGVTIVRFRQHQHSYSRAQFGAPWTDNNDAPAGHNGCDTRDDILLRDAQPDHPIRLAHRYNCNNAVIEADFIDPYTGKHIHFLRGQNTSKAIQIDHIVPLSYAWDMGAQYWDNNTRIRFANDPMELVAVSEQANMNKVDLPAGQWQPPNRGFRCQYNAQFAAIIRQYHLNVDIATANALRYYARICTRI